MIVAEWLCFDYGIFCDTLHAVGYCCVTVYAKYGFVCETRHLHCQLVI